MNFSHLSAGELRALQNDASYVQLSDDAKRRFEWFMFAAENDASIEETCDRFQISRSTFLRWVKRCDLTNLSSLEEKSRRPHAVREPETDPQVIEHIKHYREQFPTMGKKRIATLLKAEHGVAISVSSIGRVINRHGLYFADTPLHRRKRLEATKNRESGIAETSLADFAFHPTVT